MTSFAALGLSPLIIKQLGNHNFTVPFPIQQAAIPDALAGKDLLGRAPTGSGKTLAFGLPMLDRLAASGVSVPRKPRGLIVVPTRELALQIQDRLSTLAQPLGLRVLELVGGVNLNKQIRLLAAPVDIAVVTPGRAQQLLQLEQLDFSHVVITAIDEADHMADVGFLPQVSDLLRATPAHSQRMLFSATLDEDVAALVEDFLDEPVTHSTADVSAAVDTMTHIRLQVATKEEKDGLVRRIAQREGKTIMFMRTKYNVDRQVKKLRRLGLDVAGLHGNMGQTTRTQVIDGFTRGTIPVLVATDIAARGIDISQVDLVVHIDPPAEHKGYLHRAGRTARAGSVGTVATIVLPTQIKEVDRLLKTAGVSAQTFTLAPDSPQLDRLVGPAMAVVSDQQPVLKKQQLPRRKTEGKAPTADVEKRNKRRTDNQQQRNRKQKAHRSAWGGDPQVTSRGSQNSQGKNRRRRVRSGLR